MHYVEVLESDGKETSMRVGPGDVSCESVVYAVVSGPWFDATAVAVWGGSAAVGVSVHVSGAKSVDVTNAEPHIDAVMMSFDFASSVLSSDTESTVGCWASAVDDAVDLG